MKKLLYSEDEYTTTHNRRNRPEGQKLLKNRLPLLFLLALLSLSNAIPIDAFNDQTCVGTSCTTRLYANPQYSQLGNGSWTDITDFYTVEWNATQYYPRVKDSFFFRDVRGFVKLLDNRTFSFKEIKDNFGSNINFSFDLLKGHSAYKWSILLSFKPSFGAQVKTFGFYTKDGSPLCGGRFCTIFTGIANSQGVMLLNQNDSFIEFNSSTLANGYLDLDPTVTINSSEGTGTISINPFSNGTYAGYINSDLIRVGRDSTSIGLCGLTTSTKKCRGALIFNVSAIPENSVVNSIVLYVAGYLNGSKSPVEENKTLIYVVGNSTVDYFNTSNVSRFTSFFNLTSQFSTNISFFNAPSGQLQQSEWYLPIANVSTDPEAIRFLNALSLDDNYTIGLVQYNASTTIALESLSGMNSPYSPYIIVNYQVKGIITNITSPTDGSTVNSLNIPFSAVAASQFDIANGTLYGNFSGSWNANITQAGNANYSQVLSLSEGVYLFNIQECDTTGLCAFSLNNYTVRVVQPPIPTGYILGNEFWTTLPFFVLAGIFLIAWVFTGKIEMAVIAAIACIIAGTIYVNGIVEVYPVMQTTNAQNCSMALNVSSYPNFNITLTNQTCNYNLSQIKFTTRDHYDDLTKAIGYLTFIIGALVLIVGGYNYLRIQL